MKNQLTSYSNPNERLRLKKALVFIREVVRSYEIGLCDHVGFSCALAISKAQELKSQVGQLSHLRLSFDILIEGLNELYQGKYRAIGTVSDVLDNLHTHFELEHLSLIPRSAPD